MRLAVTDYTVLKSLAARRLAAQRSSHRRRDRTRSRAIDVRERTPDSL